MSHRFRLLAALLVFGAAVPAPAEEAVTARTILDGAIEALGGARLLTAETALAGTSRGTLHLNNMQVPVRNEWTVQGVDQFKWVSVATLNDSPSNIVLVLNKNKAWIKGGDNGANELPREQVEMLRQGFAGLRLAENPLPLRGKEYRLSTLGEIKVADRLAVGIKAVRKGQPDLDLFFDKKTRLPVKATMRIKDLTETDVGYTATFSAYKAVNGRQFFTKLTVHRDDMLGLEMERADFKASEKLDAATFDRP